MPYLIVEYDHNPPAVSDEQLFEGEAPPNAAA